MIPRRVPEPEPAYQVCKECQKPKHLTVARRLGVEKCTCKKKWDLVKRIHQKEIRRQLRKEAREKKRPSLRGKGCRLKGWRGVHRIQRLMESRGFQYQSWPHMRFLKDCFGWADYVAVDDFGCIHLGQVKNCRDKPGPKEFAEFVKGVNEGKAKRENCRFWWLREWKIHEYILNPAGEVEEINEQI